MPTCQTKLGRQQMHRTAIVNGCVHVLAVLFVRPHVQGRLQNDGQRNEHSREQRQRCYHQKEHSMTRFVVAHDNVLQRKKIILE